jgi:S1-C subfamily serine protease
MTENENNGMTAEPIIAGSGPNRRGSRRLATLAIAGALFLGVAGGGVAGAGATLYLFGPQGKLKAEVASAAQPTATVLTQILNSGQTTLADAKLDGTVAGVYKAVSPSVVTVMVKQTRAATPPRGTQPLQPQLPQQPDAEGEGSGVIVDAQGHILTNEHVVNGATDISVRLADGSEYAAKVVGTAPDSDLAIVQASIPADKLAVATLGDSSAVQPGDPAIAIGSPFGLDQTVTAGIVSGINREFGTANGRPMRGLIQTDAPVNPGNSGGPLLNAKGEVVGITTSIESPVRGSVGVGFAIPSNTAKQLLPKLVAGAKIEHPYLGISGIAITATVAQQQKLPVQTGVLVGEVASGGPAEKAGLKGGSAANTTSMPVGGDIITAVDKRAVTSVPEISGYLDTKAVGDTVTLSILRDGKPMDITVTLAAWPASQSS